MFSTTQVKIAFGYYSFYDSRVMPPVNFIWKKEGAGHPCPIFDGCNIQG
jgi:hypothetical protein